VPVKVADFGLAKASDAGQSGLTKTNMAMGTPDFVAPEALIPGIPLDGRADLYAIGVMLYQMLTGEIPRGIWTLPGTKLGTDPRFDASSPRRCRRTARCAIKQRRRFVRNSM
jgi:serine/threonine protein kinase